MRKTLLILIIPIIIAAEPSPEPPPDITSGKWILVWYGIKWNMNLKDNGDCSCYSKHLTSWNGYWSYNKENRILLLQMRDSSSSPPYLWEIKLKDDMTGVGRRLNLSAAPSNIPVAINKK